ncbi:Asp-tRNA(Asn)/Glu-tRNA(Gln) amidotransferase subunit GatC [Aquirufa nivalisilvae]|uniref:Aspartyl/glutamyl-tRNA(Asn/Gln) amidotransferase subunit C n=1 Tax=Aquirufa nivalisilvae TaxID=2516557 RepID=A0A2S2DTK7_9BACT|nr:Asp-tRNA(Asn)/Glu-tRNA(Gln) amidotransferase subunit GatC [Aquirufa nivalisilvae]AWL08734.1 Asparaginyl-tRNA synthase (glutamine-hydrolyzing) [Aquirufa nivalisilvae]MCZ2479206.1 Asp-tRNA(Asn)/Glu-tRNA(Gln) amidotransferase subunit GatC [Aquirufa nivalisilvae]MCZ2483113.1 Asp-tRNA(Asn)/Glu-tRNA(Gln) amidotransferase subunit GatC [Aquirufa nivalisilvae]
MKVNKDDVIKIAHLARLELKEEKIQDMQDSINKVLDWMEALNAVDTSSVEPLVHMTPALNHFREDQAKAMLDRQKALNLGPNTNESYFKVPQVIE